MGIIATLAGHAATFGNVSPKSGLMIQRGAFAVSINEWADRGKLPPMLLKHDKTLPVIGQWTNMREDNTGLFVEGEIALYGALGQEVREQLVSGAYTLSVSGTFAIKTEDKTRVIFIDLEEISLVERPGGDPWARICTVKIIEPPLLETSDRWKAVVERAKSRAGRKSAAENQSSVAR